VFEHVVRDHEAEHRVTEELHALVRLLLAVLGTPRPVRERAHEQLTVGERDTETGLELAESLRRSEHAHGRARRSSGSERGS
jgi:hypothetical protein